MIMLELFVLLLRVLNTHTHTHTPHICICTCVYFLSISNQPRRHVSLITLGQQAKAGNGML